MFQKILIANRGEIAVRVIRACRELGVKTVAVYSDADAEALHVKMADEAVHIGPAPSRESYLVKERILQAAKDTGAQAIHPGYGFLSENAEFVAMCEKAGVKFIGPTSKAMAAMGDKVSAKQNAIKAGVPVAPASPGSVSDKKEAKRIAEKIGLPVIVKAVHGGGGMGMRVVREMGELEGAIDACTAQAAAAFGNSDVFIEKFVEDPRHIEFQILGDEHGHVIHLGERECSIQRRNQKLLEEAPSPAITPEERERIGALCAKLAKSVGYSCAGTLEFLYKDGEFFFMEMNTRLQVEHPVTELVTGVDLVKWQLRVASGEKLTIRQGDVQWRGHALEVRVNAENPYQGFAPAPGLVKRFRPALGPGVRTDTYLYDGFRVPDTYDSLVAKVITYADDRASNIDRMRRVLDEMIVDGMVTNIPFHQEVVRNHAFIQGDMSTGFIRDQKIVEVLEGRAKALAAHKRLRAAAIAAALTRAPGGGLRGVYHRQHFAPTVVGGPEPSKWQKAARQSAIRQGWS